MTYSQRDLDPEKDKLRIFETAGKLIKYAIKAVKTAHCNYPRYVNWDPKNPLTSYLDH